MFVGFKLSLTIAGASYIKSLFLTLKAVQYVLKLADRFSLCGYSETRIFPLSNFSITTLHLDGYMETIGEGKTVGKYISLSSCITYSMEKGSVFCCPFYCLYQKEKKFL